MVYLDNINDYDEKKPYIEWSDSDQGDIEIMEPCFGRMKENIYNIYSKFVPLKYRLSQFSNEE